MLRDYSVAVKRALAAAETGDISAQYRVGVMYGLGLGQAQDYVLAVSWYRSAAERGDAKAQSNLGFMYGTGRGVPQDYVQAYAWYNLAAAGGEDLARKNRDAIARKMGGGQLERAQELSQELFEQIEQNLGR